MSPLQYIWRSFAYLSGQKYITLDNDESWDEIKHWAVTIHFDQEFWPSPAIYASARPPGLSSEPRSSHRYAAARPTGLSSEPHYSGLIYIRRLKRYSQLSTSVSSVSTKAAECRAFYKKCMDICDRTHTKCHEAKVGQLPTRLIYITPALSDTSTGVAYSIRLISTRDERPKSSRDTKYAALSYCWGKQAGLQLNESNYQSLLADIPYNMLSATIQDAISVTVELGLQYLWVDALCIKQGSYEDWSYEAATMCDVYRGSSITIAASGASNSGEGLFAVRDPLQQFPCGISRSSRVYTNDAEIDWEARREKDLWPLETRGWVVQEQLLPLRSIKFGSYISWRCMELAVNEFGEEQEDLWWVNVPWAWVSSLLMLKSTDPIDEGKLRYMWWTIMERYSKTMLSNEGDRLAAIDGLGSCIRRITGWRLIYGLWEPFILQELLWKVELPTRPTGLHPSWTWANFAGGTAAFNPDDFEAWKDVARYIRMPTSTSEQSPPPVITLSCTLCKIRERHDGQILVEGWPDKIPIIASYDDENRLWTDGAMLLPIGFSPIPGTYMYPVLMGLIVVPSTGSTVFERVGHFQIYTPGDAERIMELLNGRGGKAPLRQTIQLI